MQMSVLLTLVAWVVAFVLGAYLIGGLLGFVSYVFLVPLRDAIVRLIKGVVA
jgi:hypothetical protein